MIIDSHAHVVLPTSAQLADMDRAGVEQVVLFTTTPHIERAENASLAALQAELQVLNRLLSGGFSPEQRSAQMQQAIAELKGAIHAAAGRAFGFGPVPLGLSQEDTDAWVETHVLGNGFRGIGELTPGSPGQMEALAPIFKAARNYPGLPLWVHTFHPVTLEGIHILMTLCQRFPSVPVVFGHTGGVHWMEVLAFAKEQGSVFLDLSAAYTPLSVRTALAEVPERCLFGSDTPFGDAALCREMIERVSPTPAVTDLVLGGNAQRLLQQCAFGKS